MLPFPRLRAVRRRAAALAGALAVTALLSACGTLQDWRDENKGIQLESLKAADGMQATLFAKDLPKARHLAMGARGTLFVGSMAGQVYALTLSPDGSSVLRQRVVVKGLTDPSGVAFSNGELYVADRTRVVKFSKIEDQLDNPGPPVTVVSGFPDKARHDAHAMAFGPDGKFYVSVGSPCNTCEPKNDEYGTILRMNADGSGKEVIARGLRNSVGFDWHPRTRELWFTENGQDELGPNQPNDELNRVSKTGEHFGFPYCHDKDISDPEFGRTRSCSEFTPPVLGLGAHTAALGMRFQAGSTPAADPSILIARHGSHPPTRVGYDVVRVVGFAGSQRIEPFLTGFLQGTRYWGRPVDVLPMADGSVLVSDDLNGAIYRLAKAR